MPANAVVKLSEIGSGAFTATVGPQLRAKDVDHALAAGLWRPGTGHGLGVHRAHLIVSLQSLVAFRNFAACPGDVVAGHLFIGPWADVVGPATAGYGLLCADRM